MSDKKGKTTYNDSILLNIITLAVSEVDGVAPSEKIDGEPCESAEKFIQKVKFDIEGEEIYVEISIYVYFGYSVPDVAFKVQEAIKNGIENMTQQRLKDVDVTILGVKSRGE